VLARVPLADLEARVEMFAGWRALLHGDFDAAEEHARRTRDANLRIGNSNALDTYGSQMFAIRSQQGRAAELLETTLSSAATIETIPSYRAVVALIQCSIGNHAEARALLHDEFADGFASAVRNTVWATAMVNWAAVAVQLGEVDAAARLYDELAPFH